MLVEGKSGRRALKLAFQARKILDKNPSWDYTANYVQSLPGVEIRID